jgi:hypothetical protein
MNKEQLINYIVTKNPLTNIDAKQYLNSYISYMISKDIIVLSNRTLNINTNFDNLSNQDEQLVRNQIDISDFIPTNIISNIDTMCIHKIQEQDQEQDQEQEQEQKQEQKQDKNTLNMTNECISYLRLMMLIKMFKQNSKIIFPLNAIINKLNEYILDYTTKNSLNANLVKIFNDLINISENQLVIELKSLEKRDIIEFVKDNSINGYIYVL